MIINFNILIILPTKNFISFQPAISGTAVWEDSQTLSFTPDEALPSGQAYIATVKLKSVFSDVPSDSEKFVYRPELYPKKPYAFLSGF